MMRPRRERSVVRKLVIYAAAGMFLGPTSGWQHKTSIPS